MIKHTSVYMVIVVTFSTISQHSLNTREHKLERRAMNTENAGKVFTSSHNSLDARGLIQEQSRMNVRNVRQPSAIKWLLTLHQRPHMNGKPYRCEECREAFLLQITPHEPSENSYWCCLVYTSPRPRD